jgi:hypothetical protein
MVSVARIGKATAADLIGLQDSVRAELVAGTIVEKAAPSFEHGNAQSSRASALSP